MLDSNYAQGAIVLAKSLRAAKTACTNFICMVTPDIEQPVRDALSTYWKLIDVDYITVKKHPLRTKRMDFLYKKWIDYSCTKWRFLNILDEFNEYEQIMYIDADSCVLKNIDHVFFQNENDTMLSAYKAKLCLFSCFQTINTRILKNELTHLVGVKERNYYQNYPTNLNIPIELLNTIWTTTVHGKCENQFLMSGAVIVWKKANKVKPQIAISDLIIKNATNERNTIFSGHKSLFYNGWDEQILMQSILDGRRDIAIEHLPLCYCWTSGFYRALPPNIQPYIMTFWGLKKPWYFDENVPVKYMDVYIWKYFSLLR